MEDAEQDGHYGDVGVSGSILEREKAQMTKTGHLQDKSSPC